MDGAHLEEGKPGVESFLGTIWPGLCLLSSIAVLFRFSWNCTKQLIRGCYWIFIILITFSSEIGVERLRGDERLCLADCFVGNATFWPAAPWHSFKCRLLDFYFPRYFTFPLGDNGCQGSKEKECLRLQDKKADYAPFEMFAPSCEESCLIEFWGG